jgi:hypothetical protein
VCTYDFARFTASSIVDVLRSHPAAIIGGMVHENPFFISADELIEELSQRRGQQASS